MRDNDGPGSACHRLDLGRRRRRRRGRCRRRGRPPRSGEATSASGTSRPGCSRLVVTISSPGDQRSPIRTALMPSVELWVRAISSASAPTISAIRARMRALRSRVVSQEPGRTRPWSQSSPAAAWSVSVTIARQRPEPARVAVDRLRRDRELLPHLARPWNRPRLRPPRPPSPPSCACQEPTPCQSDVLMARRGDR